MATQPLRQAVCAFDLPLLDDLTGGIEVGDLVAIIGATGCGKSTFGRHLLRQWNRQGIDLFIIDTQQHASTTALQLAALAAGKSPRDCLHAGPAEAAGEADRLSGVAIRGDGDRALAELILRGDQSQLADGDPVAGPLPGLVYVDELSGLANPYDRQASSDVLRRLKAFAVLTGIPVILLVSAPRETDARQVWLESLGPFADKILQADGLIQGRTSTPHLVLLKNRKVAVITSLIAVPLLWSGDLQTYRQA